VLLTSALGGCALSALRADRFVSSKSVSSILWTKLWVDPTKYVKIRGKRKFSYPFQESNLNLSSQSLSLYRQHYSCCFSLWHKGKLNIRESREGIVWKPVKDGSPYVRDQYSADPHWLRVSKQKGLTDIYRSGGSSRR
jgi:hypothetical protein